MKIVINTCYGGFSISALAAAALAARGNKEAQDRLAREEEKPPSAPNLSKWGMHLYDTPRNDPTLISVIEELGLEASGGRFASLRIVEIPDDAEWQIEEYDGKEWIAETHRTWP